MGSDEMEKQESHLSLMVFHLTVGRSIQARFLTSNIQLTGLPRSDCPMNSEELCLVICFTFYFSQRICYFPLPSSPTLSGFLHSITIPLDIEEKV
jgi:hypothetical protein